MTTHELPSEITSGATLSGNEYGWKIPSFPDALAAAEENGYACLGGQFQFRLAGGGICEMYWLDADSQDRQDGESWGEYSHRSCKEVLENFYQRVSETDFKKQAAQWPLPIDPEGDLVFVAYFVNETDLTETANQRRS